MEYETQLIIPETDLKKEEILRKPGLTQELMFKIYEEWTKDSAFDTYLQSANYRGPAVLADAVAKYFPDRKGVRILDVGSGTGYVGKELKNLGFYNIDALDPTEALLRASKEKDVYRKYLCAFFTSHVKELQTSVYDVLVTCGTFIEGHMKCEALPEMIRCVKPGGHIFLVLREMDVFTVPELQDRLEPLMKELEDEGQWTRLERRIFPCYMDRVIGILFIFKVTK